MKLNGLKQTALVLVIVGSLTGSLWGLDTTYARKATVTLIVNEIGGLRLDALYARLSQLLQITERRTLTAFEKVELDRIRRNIERLEKR